MSLNVQRDLGVGSSPHGNTTQPDYVGVVKAKRMRPLKICWDLGPLVSIGSENLNQKSLPGSIRRASIQLSRRSGQVRTRRLQTKVRNRRQG